MTDAELLSATIKASQMTVRGFARDVLIRNPRTVWRWLAGEYPMPQAVREKCLAMLKAGGGSHDD